MSGWTNPNGDEYGPPDAAFHHYPSDALDTPSTCGTWGFEPGVDRPLLPLPPKGARRCRRCLRILQGSAVPLTRAEKDAIEWDETETNRTPR